MFGGVPIFRTQITWALQGCSFVWKKRLGVRIANNKLQLGRHGSFLGVPHCFRWAKSAWSPSHWSSCDFLPLKHHLDNRTVANLIYVYIYMYHKPSSMTCRKWMDGFPAMKKVCHIISDWHFFWNKKLQGRRPKLGYMAVWSSQQLIGHQTVYISSF